MDSIPRSCREETPAALKAVLNRSGQSPYDLKSEPSRPSAFITLLSMDVQSGTHDGQSLPLLSEAKRKDRDENRRKYASTLMRKRR